MSDFDRLINASDLTEWIVESFPDWCEGDVRSILDHIYEMPTHPTPSNTLGALESGHSELEKNSKELENKNGELMSREYAIDDLHGRDPSQIWDTADIEVWINALPSAQPEQKWETCFDCPLSHGCPKINGCTNGQTMEYASEVPDDCPISVQPRNGKWIEYDDGWANIYYECSVCKEPFVLIDGTPADNLYNFCPHCGADMREGEQK